MNAKKPEKIISKPFVQGSPIDSKTAFSALRLFGVTLVAALVFLICGSVVTSGIAWFRILMGTCLMLGYWFICYTLGVSAGTANVDYGEKLFKRQERGEQIDEKTRSQSYHPLKGGVNAFLSMLPLLFCAVLLAFVATRQDMGYGALPSWISSFETRTEIGAPLSYYHVTSSMRLEDVLRIIVRLVLMPVVGMIGTDNPSALLQMERMSALILMIMPIIYAVGYMQGPKVRSQVHTDIAANNRKRVRKEKKRIQQRRAAAHKDNQLN